MPRLITDPVKQLMVNTTIPNDFPPFLLAGDKDFLDGSVYRSYYCSIFYFRSGNAQFDVGSKTYTVKEGDVAMIGPGLPYYWEKRDGMAFDAIFFNQELFGRGFDNSFFFKLDYFCPDANNILRVEKKEGIKIFLLFDTLKSFSFKPVVVPGILHALLMLLQEHFKSGSKMNTTKATSGKEMFVSLFKALVAEHFASQKNVSYYASALNISPKYLSEILIEETGWAAKKWIQYHLIVEAKNKLIYSSLPIKEVAFHLGYHDVSHFTKTFKKWTQLTPGEFAN